VSINEADLPRVAALYEELQQLVDTVEFVPLDVEEESALALDLFAWEGSPEGPIPAREGDAP
jgi:hypothetical protein